MGEEMTFDSYEEFKKYLDDYEKQTMNHFITVKKEKRFSESDYKGKCLHWKDCSETDSCIPFVNIGQLLLGCHQGRDKNVGKKEKYRQRVAEKLKNANVKVQSRFRTHPTKKLDCPAVISLKKIAMFPGFKEELNCSLWTKRKTVLEFQQFVKGDKPIKVVYNFVAKFPVADAHKYHIQGEFAGMREPVDPLVRQKVVELVKNGVTRVPDIQKAVRAFVVKELFPDQTPPPMIRRRYHPTSRDIKNMKYVAMNKAERQKREGQAAEEPDNLDELISKNMEDHSEDKMLLAKNCGTHLGQEDIDNKSVLFCHQTREQQRLLTIYGSMIVLDIAYRSSCLPADVVFLYVRTNVDYQLVAGFIGDAGTAEVVEEGFLVMKDWNPDWTPEFFVMDHKLEMMEMVKRVFPGSEVFVSEFHREKLWRDWFAQQEPEMDQSLRDKTLELIRKMARAPTRDQYDGALKILQGCEGWISSVKLQSWFATVWHAESWVMAFQPDKLCILLSAMNGPDKLNDVLKVNYFEDFSIDTLFDVIQNYKDEVVPNFFQRYLESNIRCSSSYGKLNKAMPVYLKDRPLDLVSHVMARSPVPTMLTDNVMQLENGTFTVLNEKGRHHPLSLGDEDIFPSCTCSDWLQHWLPCRHMLAVFHHLGDQSSWQQLSPLYSNSPIFSLDEECILQQTTSPKTTPQDSMAVEVQTWSASKRVTPKHSLAELHRSGAIPNPNASPVDGNVAQNSVQMEDASDMESEDNEAAYQVLAQMGATPTVAEFPSEKRATASTETVDIPATSSATTDAVISEPRAEEMDTSCILPTPQNIAITGNHESLELKESVEPHTATSNTCTTVPVDKQREDELTSIQVLQQNCNRHLEQLLQATPTITDQTVLQIVLSHLECALKEVNSGS